MVPRGYVPASVRHSGLRNRGRSWPVAGNTTPPSPGTVAGIRPARSRLMATVRLASATPSRTIEAGLGPSPKSTTLPRLGFVAKTGIRSGAPYGVVTHFVPTPGRLSPPSTGTATETVHHASLATTWPHYRNPAIAEPVARRRSSPCTRDCRQDSATPTPPSPDPTATIRRPSRESAAAAHN